MGGGGGREDHVFVSRKVEKEVQGRRLENT